MLLQELPTKMVRHVVRSVTWSDLDIGDRTARAPADWLQFYYLARGASNVLFRKIRQFIANLGR